jgi:hypothetical protein
MADVATLEEFASFLQIDLDTATANLLLRDLAQGLITEVIGEQDPWPVTAKVVALASAGRSYRNPEGLKQETVGGTTAIYNAEEMGVYLTDSEVARLVKWKNGGRARIGTVRLQSGYPPLATCRDEEVWRSGVQ